MNREMPGSWQCHVRGFKFWLAVVGFAEFQWFRKWCGGKWEQWHVDSPVNSVIWHDVKEFSKDCGERPPLCRGTPVLEDWT